jgi:hypothetical protein
VPGTVGVQARASGAGGTLNAIIANSIFMTPTDATSFSAYEYSTNGGTAALTLSKSIATSLLGPVDTFDPIVPGTGEPKYVSPADNDFRLRGNQAAIDKSPLLDSDPIDANGEARMVDGDGNGVELSDLGAFEYQRRAPDAYLTGPVKLTSGQSGEFDARGTIDADGDDMTYAWDFGDGSPVDTSGPVANHSYSPGKFILKLTVTDEAGLTDESTLSVDVVAPINPPVLQPELPRDVTGPVVTVGKIKPNKKGTTLNTKVTCPTTETKCTITLSYTARTGKTGKAKKYAKDVTVQLVGGKSATVTLKLNSATLKVIKNKGNIKGSLIIQATDSSSNSTTKTVKYTAKQGKTGSAK